MKPHIRKYVAEEFYHCSSEVGVVTIVGQGISPLTAYKNWVHKCNEENLKQFRMGLTDQPRIMIMM